MVGVTKWCSVGKFSRSKGKRGERQLVEELRRLGWGEAVREGWKQVRGGQDAAPDVMARPPGWGTAWYFEVKVRAKGFELLYKAVPPTAPFFGFSTDTGKVVIVARDPGQILTAIRTSSLPNIADLPQHEQKAAVKLLRMEEWVGDAQVLAFKQDRQPFLYARYY